MHSSAPLHVVILAAGMGTRMRSSIPKVLHALAGMPLIEWVIQAALGLNPASIHLIYGQDEDRLKAALNQYKLHWIHQAQQLGTAHALSQALPHIPDDGRVLVLSGDVPLIRTDTLRKLVDCYGKEDQKTPLCLLLANLVNPEGLGRVVRNDRHEIVNIIEEKDAAPHEQAIQEIYTGICTGKAGDFKHLIPHIHTQNAQQEYYLTQIVPLAIEHHLPIQSLTVDHAIEVQGVNTQRQLNQLERYWQHHLAEQLLERGTMIADPRRIDIRGTLQAEQDVFIDVNVVFEGNNVLKKGCKIGPNCVLKNATIGEHTQVFAHSVIENAVFGQHCHIGPFARVRPGTILQDHCKIGNFVETKNAHFGEGSKANHLTYLGDVTLGQHVNVGAGTITCNYDGANKHLTIIEDDAFIGSGTQLVAPIRVGKGATLGAGTTLRQDAPPDALTLTAKQQVTVKQWKRKKQ